MADPVFRVASHGPVVSRLVDQRPLYEVCGSMTEDPVELFDDSRRVYTRPAG